MDKLKGLISIARKAGYTIAGLEKLENYDKKLFLVLIDATAGKSLRREANFFCQKRGLEPIEIKDLPDLVSIENCKVVGIKNKNLSDSIVSILKGE